MPWYSEFTQALRQTRERMAEAMQDMFTRFPGGNPELVAKQLTSMHGIRGFLSMVMPPDFSGKENMRRFEIHFLNGTPALFDLDALALLTELPGSVMVFNSGYSASGHKLTFTIYSDVCE